MPAVALTDTNGLYAAVPFYQAAKAAGIKPIVGVVIDVEFRVSHFTARNSKNETRNSQSVAMVLLAADMEGYSNLCQLVTLRHLGTTELAKNDLEECDGRPVTLEELAKHSRGVIALCPLPPRMHDADDRRGTARRARPEIDAPIKTGVTCKTDTARLKDIFGDRLWIEVQHLSPGDGRSAARGRTDRARTRRAAGGDEQCLFSAAGRAFASSRGECDTHRRFADDRRGSGHHHRRSVVQAGGGNAKTLSGSSGIAARDARHCGSLQSGAHAEQNHLPGISRAGRTSPRFRICGSCVLPAHRNATARCGLKCSRD